MTTTGTALMARMSKTKRIDVALMACLSELQNRQGENAEQNTDQRTRDNQAKDNTPARVLGRASSSSAGCCLYRTEPAPKVRSITRNSTSCAVWFCLHPSTSSVQRPKFQKTEISEAMLFGLGSVRASPTTPFKETEKSISARRCNGHARRVRSPENYLDATGASPWTSASKRGSLRSGSHTGFPRKSP